MNHEFDDEGRMHYILSLKPKPAHKCQVIRCRNDAGQKNRFCSKHKMQAWRTNNPLKYRFEIVRKRAKRRGQTFTLSFLQYERLVAQSDYELDRRDALKGYENGNCQILPRSENRKKAAADKLAHEQERARQKGNNPF